MQPFLSETILNFYFFLFTMKGHPRSYDVPIELWYTAQNIIVHLSNQIGT